MPASGLLFGAIVFVPSALFYLIALRPKDTMTETKFDLSKITKTIAGVRVAAAERPDFVYDAEYVDMVVFDGVEYRRRSPSGDCQYVEQVNGELCGSCLVGWGALAAGIEPEALEYQGDPFGLFRMLDILPGHFDRVELAEEGYEQATSEVDWLGLVQKWQDRGWPWGHAVEMADLGRSPSYPHLEDEDELHWTPILKAQPA